MVMVIALLLAGVGGVGAALARRSLRDVIDVADDIEKHTGLPVYATVPHSTAQDELHPDRRGALAPVNGERTVSAQRNEDARLLVTAAPDDPAIEALRTLRNSLQFAIVGARNNIVAIGSPAPGAGKSFVIANLAVLLAETGRKMLIVDADLRRGCLHRLFGRNRSPGLTDVLAGSATLEAALLPTPVPGLHLLSTGTIPPNPSELLATSRFETILAEASKRCELMIVDTAPTLAVADSTLVAACAGVTLLILRAGQQSMREIDLTVERFAQNGTPVQGAVLNDARAVLGSYGRYGKRYEYGPRP